MILKLKNLTNIYRIDVKKTIALDYEMKVKHSKLGDECEPNGKP